MTPGDLLDAARDLAYGGAPPRPEAHLRRAVSTAYYAVFHCLAGAAADAFVGKERASHPAWSLVYRALDHGGAQRRCNALSPGSTENQRRAAGRIMERFGFPRELQDVASTFVHLQNRRHLADYKPYLDEDEHLDTTDVVSDIQRAKEAVESMAHAAAPDRRAFAAYLLFPERR